MCQSDEGCKGRKVETGSLRYSLPPGTSDVVMLPHVKEGVKVCGAFNALSSKLIQVGWTLMLPNVHGAAELFGVRSTRAIAIALHC